MNVYRQTTATTTRHHAQWEKQSHGFCPYILDLFLFDSFHFLWCILQYWFVVARFGSLPFYCCCCWWLAIQFLFLLLTFFPSLTHQKHHLAKWMNSIRLLLKSRPVSLLRSIARSLTRAHMHKYHHMQTRVHTRNKHSLLPRTRMYRIRTLRTA